MDVFGKGDFCSRGGRFLVGEVGKSIMEETLLPLLILERLDETSINNCSDSFRLTKLNSDSAETLPLEFGLISIFGISREGFSACFMGCGEERGCSEGERGLDPS
jgi:hypothetical protein